MLFLKKKSNLCSNLPSRLDFRNYRNVSLKEMFAVPKAFQG